MLKINLLPAYVVERRKVRVFKWLAAIVLAAQVIVLGALWTKQKQYLSALEEAKNTKSSEASQVSKLQQDANNERAKSQPFQNVIDFIDETKKAPGKRARLLRELSRFIYWQTLVSEIDISDGQNVRLTCATYDVDDYARFMMNIMQAQGHLFDQPPVPSGIGGGGGGGGGSMMGGGMGGRGMGMAGGDEGMPVGMGGMGGGMRGGMMGGGSGGGGSSSGGDNLRIQFTVMAHLAPDWQLGGAPAPKGGDVTVSGGGGGGGGGGADMGMSMGGGMMGGMGGGAMGGAMGGAPMGGAPMGGMGGGSGVSTSPPS